MIGDAPAEAAVVVVEEPSPKRKCLGGSESQTIELDSTSSPELRGGGSESQAVELDSPSLLSFSSPVFACRGYRITLYHTSHQYTVSKGRLKP